MVGELLCGGKPFTWEWVSESDPPGTLRSCAQPQDGLRPQRVPQPLACVQMRWRDANPPGTTALAALGLPDPQAWAEAVVR